MNVANPERGFSFKKFSWIVFGLIAVGIAFRFYQITRNDFYFYDEGMFLSYGRTLFHNYTIKPSHSFSEILQAIFYWPVYGFCTDRPLWQMMVDARFFWGGLETFWYVRFLSAVIGTLTLGMVYLFAKRFFNSKVTALLSVLFLALLPSHVFYSRLGLPEAATTLLFLAGFYFYLFPRTLGWRTFLSGILFVCAFFTNYRFLIFPGLVFFAEFFISSAQKRPFDRKKWLWNTLVFFFFVFLACLLNNGAYFKVTSAWSLRQIDLAQEHFAWANLFSYPYMLFRLEGWPFGLLLLGNIYFVARKEWGKLLPWAMVCLQMALFSFSSDKAARYVAAVTPFMAMSAAVLIVSLFQDTKGKFFKGLAVIFCILTIGMCVMKSVSIVKSHSSAEDAVKYLKTMDPHPKIVTTQPLILGLFLDYGDEALSCPDVKDPAFFKLSDMGYRYLVFGMQAHVSWTRTGVSFEDDLGGPLEFFDKRVQPIKTFPAMSSGMLERFVFEHNQNLMDSISFLNEILANPVGRRVYDLPQGVSAMKSSLAQWSNANQQN
ncbi:MAG: glycosyltransferase family 39 protein [Candidatus Omnitrophica bacterium]|nr:glycosyltransferase family 39 protein [Candidatus Omnitrophota bacterium]